MDPDFEQALAGLFVALREAKGIFEASTDAGRQGAIDALYAVATFLGALQTENLEAPLVCLFTALVHLNAGGNPQVLKRKKKTGRPRANPAYDHLKGLAVYTIRRLQGMGMSLRAARNATAAALAKAGIRPARKCSAVGAGQLTERTMRKWQEGIDSGGPGAYPFRLCDMKFLQDFASIPSGTTADEVLLSRIQLAELQPVISTAWCSLCAKHGPEKPPKCLS